jgi:N-acyl-L-homoserine lactone synthetase
VIHLVTAQNRSAYQQELVKLYRMRKTVFVDTLGWQLDVRDGLEIDEYDDDRAMCVIGFDTEKDVAMSVRFRPTDDRSMLVDHFSRVLPAGIRPINDSKTWEVSRGFCVESGRRRRNLMRKAACMISPLEVALAAGVDRLVGFSDVRMLTFFVNIGWRLSQIGEAIHYGEGDGFAYEVEVSEEAIEGMRRRWGLPKPSYINLSAADRSVDVHSKAARIAAAVPAFAQLMPVPETRSQPSVAAQLNPLNGHVEQRESVLVPLSAAWSRGEERQQDSGQAA